MGGISAGTDGSVSGGHDHLTPFSSSTISTGSVADFPGSRSPTEYGVVATSQMNSFKVRSPSTGRVTLPGGHHVTPHRYSKRRRPDSKSEHLMTTRSVHERSFATESSSTDTFQL